VRTIALVSVCVVAWFGLFGGAFSRADDFEDARAGHVLFDDHCALCHGPDGTGHGPLADDLRVPPADLTGIALRRAGSFPDVEITEIIDGRHPVRGHGGKEMPIWGRALGGNIADPAAREAAIAEKIRQLVAYLRSIQHSPPHTVGQR
jgi:mono/diheme cytochrome c family protein